MTGFKQVKNFIANRPYQAVLLVALVVRLIAVIFSKGYGMHDDHFSIIEASKSWVDGTDYNNWLPKNQIVSQPDGHSFFYVGLHYLLFYLMKAIGLTSPNAQMFIIRFLHGMFSLISVACGYKITEKLSGRRTAIVVGLLLAAMWFMPFLSVRNLVEVVATPVLLLGLWKIIKSTGAGRTALNYFLVGFIMGLAFSIRFQTIIFIGGVGLAILLEKKWKEAVFFGLGTLFSMSLIQGVIDIFIWGRPFAELTEYILYNLAHSDDYGTRNFWMYFQTIPAMLIPPVGILLFFGFFMQWRKHLLIFVPTFLFFMFHTVFPNKQERFIFTVIPMFVILGTIGWMSFTSTSRFWIKNSKLLNAGYLFSLLINIMLLSVLTVSYSKKARVEASLYLSRYENLRSIVIEETSRSSAQMIPVFYMNNWITVYVLGNPPYARDHHPSEISPTGRIFREIYSIHFFDHQPQERQPQFVIFVGDKDIDYRISAAKRVFPHLINETSFEPGFVDRIMHRLTPANNNQTLYLYRTRIGDYTLKE